MGGGAPDTPRKIGPLDHAPQSGVPGAQAEHSALKKAAAPQEDGACDEGGKGSGGEMGAAPAHSPERKPKKGLCGLF